MVPFVMAITCAAAGIAAARTRTAIRMLARISVFLPDDTQFEICSPLLGGIGPIEQERSINPNLFCFAIDAERITRPKHDVRVLTGPNRSDLFFPPHTPDSIHPPPTNPLPLHYFIPRPPPRHT